MSIFNTLLRGLPVSLPAWPLLALGLSVDSLSAQPSVRFPLPVEQVLLAMQARNWPTEGIQVRLGTPITATTPKPTLEVKAISRGAGSEALLSMACHVRTECLPFFAFAVWPANVPLPVIAASFQGRLGTVSASQAKSLTPVASAEAIAAPSAVIRAGTPATLLLEGSRTHIRLRVVLAQGGHVGEKVRVTTPDRRQTYVGEVVTPELLQGEF